jgi:hypothetical protein
MSVNYTTYTSQIANITAISSNDANFQTMLPGMIDYAEQRMYRETDLLATRVTDSTGNLTTGNRTFTLPTDVGTYLVIEEANVISPATATSSTGTRIPLVNTSRSFIDLCYPSNVTAQGVPEFFAMKDNATILVGPSPNSSYIMEIRGTQRPTPLSAANSSTILTQMLPDAFIAASMVFAAGYMRDFGAQSDNPQMAQSWETQYKTLIQSANVEELRKKYQSQAWTNQLPNPLVQPPRV